MLKEAKPDMVLAHGDTQHLPALAAYYQKVPVATKAGLRTGNRYSPYPEEMNRRLISEIAQLHFSYCLECRKLTMSRSRRNLHNRKHSRALHTTVSDFSLHRCSQESILTTIGPPCNSAQAENYGKPREHNECAEGPGM